MCTRASPIAVLGQKSHGVGYNGVGHTRATPHSRCESPSTKTPCTPPTRLVARHTLRQYRASHSSTIGPYGHNTDHYTYARSTGQRVAAP
eukprot:1821488-Rhodomonas_salina.5